MRYLFTICLLGLLSACGAADEPIPDANLPALVLLSDDRCALIEKGQLRHETTCAIDETILAYGVRTTDTVCGEYRFARGSYTPMVCERGCTPNAQQIPGCPLRHGPDSTIWSFYDRR